MIITETRVCALLMFFGMVMLSYSCDNTLDLVEEKIETPVVYSMLNYEDEYQYVRLERAFASANESALVLAKNPDSLYYPNAEVKLTRVRNGVSLEKTLEKVDGNVIGYPREDGVFATAPNVLYRIKTSELLLAPLDIVKLTIDINEGELIKAETKIIEKSSPSAPISGSPVSFATNQAYTLRWNAAEGKGGVLHSPKIIIHITEEINGGLQEKALEWPIVINTDKESYKLEAGAFYTFLANNLIKDTKIKRYFNNLDFYISSGDENYANYILVSQANTGITSSGEIPTFSNLSKGYGLFGSKATTSLLGLGISVSTLENLRTSALTKDLNFQ